MPSQNVARGVFLTAVALAFGLGALRYPLGDLAHAGAGLFPLIVSSLLFIVGILTIVQARFVENTPLHIDVKNIGLVMSALVAFVVVAKFVNMVLAIVAMVFIVSVAGTSYSVKRNILVSAALIAVAYAFEKFLGLNLHLPLI